MQLPSCKRILSSNRINQETKDRYTKAVEDLQKLIDEVDPVAVWLFNRYPTRDFGDEVEVDYVIPMLTDCGIAEMDRAAARRIINYPEPGTVYLKRTTFWDKWRAQRIPGIESYFEKSLHHFSKLADGPELWRLDLEKVSDHSLTLYRLDHEDSWKKEYIWKEGS